MSNTSENTVSIKSMQIPGINFREAVDKVQKLYKADGLSGSTKETAVKHLGYSGINGASVKIIADLKKFDLVSESGGRIVISEHGKNILVLPENDPRKKESLKFCALYPKIFSELYNIYKEHGLPSDLAIKGDLILKYNLNERLVINIVKDFKESLVFADIKLGESESTEMIDIVEESKDSVLNSNQPSLNISSKIHNPQSIDIIHNDLQNYRIPRKGGKFANLQLESPVSNEDIEAIQKWLEVLKFTIVEDTEENG